MSPTLSSVNSSDEPPALMNGSGMPLVGSRPRTTLTLMKRLQHDGEGQARGQEGAEGVGRLPGRAQAAPEEEDEAEHHRRRAQQPQLLADHGVDEVAVRVGQVEELLPPFHEAHAGEAAGAHRDQALDDLVAGAARVRPGVEVGLDAVAPVGGAS